MSRRRLEATLEALGHEVFSCEDGVEAWEAFQGGGDFQLIITDWLMPRLSGIELCRKIREAQVGSSAYAYVILLTGHDQGLIEGMEAGADDFITKPFRPDELRVRIQAGLRVLALERALSTRVDELEQALARVRRLEGLLPICSYCKKIRHSEGPQGEKQEWESVESYVTHRSEAKFSHSICPTCYDRELAPELGPLPEA